MSTLYTLLVSWLPTPLHLVACGVFAIFILVTLLRVIALILDVIPFL